MVESYELKTGGFPDWELWHDSTTETPPYKDLEPRFHASILYNGASWKGRTIEPYVGGADGWMEWNTEREPKGRTCTGYYLRKMVDEGHDVIAYSGGTQPIIVLRYAEVLLNGQSQLDVAVAGAGVGDVKHESALLQFAGGGNAFSDMGFPAIGIHIVVGVKVELLVHNSVSGLLGDHQGGVLGNGLAVLLLLFTVWTEIPAA